MKETYRSTVEWLILIPLGLILSALLVYMIWNAIWIGVIGTAIFSLFLVYIYMDTSYELTSDQKLKIKSGFLYHKEIYIKSIKKIRPTRNHIASPALSGDRIEIQFNRYERVLISPGERARFIDRLKKVNPSILLL